MSLLFLGLVPAGDLLAQAIPNRHAGVDTIALPAPIRHSSRLRPGLHPRPPLPNGIRPSLVGVQSVKRASASQAAASSERLKLAVGETPPDNELSAEAWEAEKARQTLTQFPESYPGEYAAPVHSHQVIRAPRIVQGGSGHGSSLHGNSAHGRSGTIASRAHQHLPPLVHHSSDQAPPPAIPDASHREVWKSPFSYGYFGASGSRHWKRHYGYRDRDSEWRLR